MIMRKLLYIPLLLLCTSQCFAQHLDNEYNRDPILIGGYDSLINATEHKRLIKDCASSRKKVFVEFLVSQEGNLSNIQIIKGLCPEQDSAAIEIVKSLQFKPGIQNGKPVEFKRVIGIPFTKSR